MSPWGVDPPPPRTYSLRPSTRLGPSSVVKAHPGQKSRNLVRTPPSRWSAFSAPRQFERMSDKIQIRMEAYDHEALDQSGLEIVDTARRTGARVTGPIPLPTRIERYTVLRSPFIDKKSREQFEIRTHKRLIYISEPTPQTINSLSSLNLPAGVDIRIKA